MENNVIQKTIAVVIPTYKVKKHILDVINRIEQNVSAIYVVDDCCPEMSGNYVQANCLDPRVKVIFHEVNKGVGAAVLSGYKQAILDGHYCAVKIDGDNQMDPSILGNGANLLI
ncbi:glycosyltransferase [Enterobacter roggenkampii]|uniref:glycosyltransferase n=2 Tax=Enterobacter cloacae complex TaxID=354276 RepID=UPI0021CAD122|nr:glycosyltransferase [Enterobacter roggenkampii]MCU3129488.1 glycosyltransferase [Enterobacter roggenkampii]